MPATSQRRQMFPSCATDNESVRAEAKIVPTLVLLVTRRWSKIETTSDEDFFMVSRRKLALYLLAALALAGAYDALRNLPVLSGCNFYSDCPENFSSDATTASATN